MRKKILIVGHNYATQFIDIYNQYIRLFDPNQFEVTVAYLTGKPDETVRQRTLTQEVLFLNASKKSIRGLKIQPVRQLLALCRKQSFHMVICHRYKPSYIMMWVALWHKIPALIFVMHEFNTMASLGRKLLTASLYRSNMLFAGVSNAVRDDLRKHLWGIPKERIITLYNMIDVELTEPQVYSREEARKLLPLPPETFSPDTFLFGNLARLVPNKDHDNLIRSFAFIKAACPNTKLIIIGNGILESRLKKQVIAAGLSADILFTGYLANGFRYMKALDCFVLSSVQEAFGRVLLEAMIAHCPIIATKTHGIPEVVGEAGLTVNPGNTHELEQAMKKIYSLSPADREQMGHKAYAHMLANFSIPIFYQQFWQLSLAQLIKE
jgi:glycosyltransferase involved in cell wall biosynthesis